MSFYSFIAKVYINSDLAIQTKGDRALEQHAGGQMSRHLDYILFDVSPTNHAIRSGREQTPEFATADVDCMDNQAAAAAGHTCTAEKEADCTVAVGVDTGCIDAVALVVVDAVAPSGLLLLQKEVVGVVAAVDVSAAAEVEAGWFVVLVAATACLEVVVAVEARAVSSFLAARVMTGCSS